MSATLQSLLDLRALLDSLWPTFGSRHASESRLNAGHRSPRAGEVVGGYSAAMLPFDAESFAADKASFTSGPSDIPVNGESMTSYADFSDT